MRFLSIFFLATLAFGQSSRVLPLSQNQSQDQMQEIATVLQAVAGTRVSTDNTTRAVTVEGTGAQLALADWLLRQMDLPTNGQYAGVHEYRQAADADDVARVFYVAHAPDRQALQELATVIRSVADIRLVYLYNPLNAVAVRGTGPQISLAAFLVDQLDQPADAAAPEPHEFKLADDDVTRVFELTNPENPRELQELVTLIRSIADIGRLFVYNPRRIIALRAKPERVALSAWLVKELDKPSDSTEPAGGPPQEYKLSDDRFNVVRIFYLQNSSSREEMQKVSAEVRAKAEIMRLFVYAPLRALTARGTADQIATAEKLLEVKQE